MSQLRQLDFLIKKYRALHAAESLEAPKEWEGITCLSDKLSLLMTGSLPDDCEIKNLPKSVTAILIEALGKQPTEPSLKSS